MKTTSHNPHGGDSSSVAQQLGIDGAPDVRIDFSVNINPLGPPSCVCNALSRGSSSIGQYPDVYAEDVVESLATVHGLSEDSVVVGNGSTELFSWILQALDIKKAAWINPCYAGYSEVCDALGIEGSGIAAVDENFNVLLDEVVKENADLVFLGSPNNPTGTVIDSKGVLSLARDTPEKWFVVDESFMDFVSDAHEKTLISKDLPVNLIVVKSLTKFFAIPGLRLGMACAHPETAARIKERRLPWSVNSLAQESALKLYDDAEYLASSRSTVKELRDYMVNRLESISGWEVMPSDVNFLLVRLPEGVTATQLQKELLEQGILIRSCANFSGLGEQYIRLAVRPRCEVDELILAINHQPSTVKHSSIMVVGTTSDAGKSVVAAGLCRYFKRRDVKVAPFKAQNMALNSFVTKEGGEMGRAQVVQAEAAGIEPHTDMNPVLLKPMGDSGSQVIVNGQPIGNFPAREYYEMKQQMKDAAHAAYDRLSAEYDIIILEGAGSPAEINLMAEDFVNMSMAEYANADVILVADIDRGGVFASIYGTVQLLPDKYRRLIKGIIINKFRGDESLLTSGIEQIEEMIGIPVLGVLPYIRDLNIEDEDSLGLDKRNPLNNAVVDIAVIRFPHISNYTDFIPLENTGGVSVRYVSEPRNLLKPDLIILPGTKNTRADLSFIEENGLADAIHSLVQKKTPVFGICGGYQMLGSRISDPLGVEGEPGDEIGLNLLPLNTVLEARKELAQVDGYVEQLLPFCKPETPFSGYEIHAGRTSSLVNVDQPLIITRRKSDDTSEAAGSVSPDGLAFGCYIHGLFDSQLFREQVLSWLCSRKDIDPPEWHTGEINNFDTLTDVIESKIDLSIMGA